MDKPKHFARSNARLDEEKVRIIRRGIAAGIPAGEYARAYGVSVEQVRKIGRREAWGWVEEDGGMAVDPMPAPMPDQDKVNASLARLQDLLKDPGKS